MQHIPDAMTGVTLPGNSTVEFREYPVPVPGHGQVLIAMKASSICGSDIRAIYREHLGKGPEGYQNVIAGRVAVTVVDRLEVIEVEHGQRTRPLGALRPPHRGLKFGKKIGAVSATG